MKPNVVFSYFIATVLAGCHSASWTPPEPQQAPAASATPPAAGTEPAPTTAPASLPPTEPASASATPDSTTTAAAAPVDTSTAAAPSAAPPSTGGKATAKTETHKVEAHKSEDAPSASDAYAGPDPCQGKSFHYGIVGATCKKSGRKGVKDIMKGVVKKAKAAGQDIQCTSCHEDTTSFHLKSNAVSDLKQWL